MDNDDEDEEKDEEKDEEEQTWKKSTLCHIINTIAKVRTCVATIHTNRRIPLRRTIALH